MRLPSIALAAAALLLAGCDTASDVADSVRTTLAPREVPQARSYAADQKTTYAAALKAMNDIGFRYTHGGPAEGVLEGLNRVDSGEVSGQSSQIALKAHLDPTPDGGTTVAVSFREIVEADSEKQQGMATQTPLGDTALNRAFLQAIQDRLAAPAAGARN